MSYYYLFLLERAIAHVWYLQSRPTISFRVNDSGEARRRMWKEFLKRDDLPEKLKCGDVDLDERYWVNDRGMLLLTSTMVPKNNAPIRGVVFLCHGYMDNSSL